MNQILKQQIAKFFGNEDEIPKKYASLFDAISNRYNEFESSIEMKNANAGLHLVTDNAQENNIIEQLKENEKKYKRLFDQNPMPMWIIDTDSFKFINVNEAAITHYGYTKEEFLAMNAQYILTEDERERYLILEESKKDILDFVGVWKHLKKNGSNIHVEIHANPILFEGKKAQLVLAKDITQRTLAEEKLKKNEALMNHAQQIAHFGCWEIDMGVSEIFYKNPLTWSDEVYRIFGYKPGEVEVTNDLFFNAVPFAEAELIKEAMRKTLENDEIYSIEHQIILPNGNFKWVKEDAELLVDGGTGKVIKIIGTVQDITERKLAEIALVESEKHYRVISESSLVGITWASAQGNLIEANDTFINMLGYNKEELIGKHFLEISLPEEKEREDIFLRKMTNNEIDNYQIEKRYVTKNKEIIWAELNVTSFKNEKGEIDYFIAIIKDITSRKKAEEQTKLTNERYELATKATNDAIWDWDLLTDKLFWSEGYEKLFGYKYSKDDANIITWSNRIHPDDVGRVINGIKDKIDNPNSDFWHDEYRYVRANGSIAYIYDRGYVVYNEDKKPIRVVGAMRDITKEKQLTEERIKIINDIMGRNKALEQFAYIISHNLRSPVVNIIALGNIIQNNSSLSPIELNKCVDGLLLSVKKLDEVITDLNYILQVSREVNEKKEIVNFTDLIQDVQDSISNLIKTENAVFKLNFENINELFTIKSYLYSIFYNLITNSLKYRKPDVSPIVEIESRKTDTKIYILYRDNGLGIDLKIHRDKIFGLYKKFHLHKEGKGMGLYMVKTQVEILGGKINVESEINKGIEFILEFDVINQRTSINASTMPDL